MQFEDKKSNSRLIPLRGVMLGALLTAPLWIIIGVIAYRFFR